MLLKTTIVNTVMLLSYLISFGQTGFLYEREWKLIDSLMFKKNLPKSALIEVNKVYITAKKNVQEAQWIKAIIYRNHLQESGVLSINEEIEDLESEIKTAPPRV